MREILFRGKRIDTGAWVEGDLVQGVNDQKGHMFIWSENDESILGVVEFEVDPETVGQYTGLPDRNGKKIFDGDLLNGFEYPYLRDNAHNYFAEVVWFDNCPAFGLYTHKHPLSAVRGISAGNCEIIEDFDSSQWEIIGNIHDNPELLEGAGTE